VLYVYLHEDRPFTLFELLLLNNLVNQAAIAIYHARQVSIIQRDLTRQQEELTLLHHAGLLISSRSGLGDTLEAILQMALEVTGARYGIFRLVDRASQQLVTGAIAGDRLGLPATESLPMNATSVMGWVAKTRRPLNIPDVSQPPWSRIYYPLDHGLDMRSELAVPLIGAGGRLLGVLNLESPEIEAFSEADGRLLQSLASQAVIAIQEVLLLDALRDTAERLLNGTASEVLDHLARLAGELLNIAGGGIWTLNGDAVVLRAAHGAIASGDPPERAEAMIRRACLTKTSLAYQYSAPGGGWQHWLVTPIVITPDQTPVGALVVRSESDDADSALAEWDKKVIGILAHYAALAFENETHQRALRAVEEARAVAETFAAMGDVAANLLHHLNNKVGTIPVRVEGIQDKYGPLLESNAYLASNLAEIERAALGAMATVRERLSLLRPIDVAPTTLRACVEDALAQARLPEGITITLSGLDDLPPVVAGREGLALALVNLLENAREAMDGRGNLTISGKADGAWAELVVSDDGPGIPAALQASIFDFNVSGSHSQESERAKRPPSRLGFGLWWVKTLATRLGGTITVESDGVNGTTFRLSIPVARSAA
jgi:signal transduction histidine kinase